MAMVNMGIHNRTKNWDNRLFRIGLLASCGAFGVQNAHAFDWRLSPYLSMSEVFSDNLTLSDESRKTGFVTEVSPGLSLYGSSPWSNLNLNYRLQGLYNAGGRDAVDVNHQLQMNGLFQPVQNTLFIQTSSSIRQQNVSNGFIAADNLTGNRGRTTSKNFSISPYWTPHFGQFASGLVKFGYQNSSFENTSLLSGVIADSEVFSKQARLTSGSDFGVVKWTLNYSSQDQKRDFGSDVRFESYQGDVRYYLNSKFNVFGVVGYENNDYPTLNNEVNNGVFYTFGGQWSPSKWYSLEAGYGNNKYVTVRYNPSDRLSSVVTYRNKDVGLNAGDSWDVNINYRAQHGGIGARYFQETATVQDVLFRQFGAFYFGDFALLMDPSLGLAFDEIINLPILVNDVIVRKQANLTFGYQTGKSSYNLSLYNTQRDYQINPIKDDVYGASASWQWRFASKYSFYLRPTWQTVDSNNAGNSSENDRYDVALGLVRAIPINLGRPLMMNTKLEFRHITQTSNLSTNNYSENRAMANFAVRF